MSVQEQHVLVFCAGYIPSVKVGVLNLLDSLKEQGEQIEYRFIPTYRVMYADILWADVIICVRGYLPQELFFLEYASQKGKFLLYYLDDDLMNLPDTVSSYSKEFVELARIFMPLIISQAGLLWTNSPEIVSTYSKYCGRAVRIDAPAPVALVSSVAHNKEHPISILFAGSQDHSAFLDELLGNCLPKILEHYNGEVVAYVLGAAPSFAKNNPYINNIPYEADFKKYRVTLAEIGAEIGLAPLPDTPFFNSKYFNKYLEYATMSISGIYSDVKPYTYIVKNNENGLLVKNVPEAWASAIQQLVEDVKLREKICTNSHIQIDKSFTIEQSCLALKESVPELGSYVLRNHKYVWIEAIVFSVKKYFRYARIVSLIKKYKWKAPFRIIQKIYNKLLGRQ